MTDQKADLFQIKKGAAVVATCIVQTICESDRTFQDRFVARLRAAYLGLRDNPKYVEEDVSALEVLSLVHELISGFSFSLGQRDPFLKDHRNPQI